jgi:solute:Na+ symporter, SSS family
VVFALGLYYAWRHGYVGLHARGVRNLVMLLGGLAFFMALQGYLQYAPMEEAPARVAGGTFEVRQTLGTPLDYGVMIAYFLAILVIGTYFARRQKTTKDFFFAGQRFSWWLVSFSLIATTVGSYSFVKYSQVAFKYGLSSTQTYLNDWFWVPLFVFGWLPILYFSRVTSIPEYFQRRFGAGARLVVTVLLLLYLIGYVGVNLFTMGTALSILLGWEVWAAAALVGTISAIYVTAGGQTSVIMTDLFQGVMLLGTGFLLLILGIDYLGGVGEFWQHLPRDHRLAFDNFNEDPSFPSVGIFWQDAIANTAVFYFLNQGVIMRFLSAKSVREGRKAAYFVPIVLMPLAAIAVASGGWVGKALEHAGVLPHGMSASEAFFVTAEFLSHPGVFGLILAALTAALMSTVDTLLTAVSAIVVNDVYKPYIRPKATDRQLLAAARVTAVVVAVIGLVLVPFFMRFDSIYIAHGTFTAAVTPPLVVALLCAVFWRRYTRQAAIATVAGGSLAIFASIIVPELVNPFTFGVPAGAPGEGLFGGAQQHNFMRALYGLVVSGALAVLVTLLTRPEPFERQRGLVWGTLSDALRAFKGSPGEEVKGAVVKAKVERAGLVDIHEASGLPLARLSARLAEALHAGVGDLVYVCDSRRWLGGLRSSHAIIGEIVPEWADLRIELGEQAYEATVASRRQHADFLVERLY